MGTPDVTDPPPRPSITALVCTLNEVENIPHVLPLIPDWVDEVLVVDGHSTDGTQEAVRRVRPDARIVTQPHKGKWDALRCGLREARGDIVVTLDADGSTDPREMGRFVEPLLQGYDYVKGSRFNGKVPINSLVRIAGNLGLTAAFDLLFLRRYTDVCSGYNAYWKRSMGRVEMDIPGDFPAEPTFHARALKAGLKVKEVSHRDGGRIGGQAKVPVWWRHGWWVLTGVVKERFRG